MPFSDNHQSTNHLSIQQIVMSNPSDIIIDTMNEQDADPIRDMIQRNLSPYSEAGNVLASTQRRLEKFTSVYNPTQGGLYLVARLGPGGTPIGGAGIGPLQGLSPAERLGEIRDLVVDEAYRSQGIGARLLKRCLKEAKNMGYERLYLETTGQMEHAQKLFVRNGFRPVTTGSNRLNTPQETMPCYYLMENLESIEG
jgi:putative acetyltransferase